MSNFSSVSASFASNFHDALLLSGALGAAIMFVADLVLYYPTAAATDDAACDDRDDSVVRYHRTARSYFSGIDPFGSDLAGSSMRHISVRRAMLGGVMGPVSAVFYSLGFLGVFFGLTASSSSSSSRVDDSTMLPAAIAAVGLSLAMTIAGVYHALFAYTCFLSKEISTAKKDDDGGGAAALRRILELHQSYLRYVFKWASLPALVGSGAFVYCRLASASAAPSDDGRVVGYGKYSVLLVPALSGVAKKLLKEHGVGGIVLCGGLTNLWNLCFFGALYLGYSPPYVSPS